MDIGRGTGLESSRGHIHPAWADGSMRNTKQRLWWTAPPIWVALTILMRVVYPSAPHCIRVLLLVGPPSQRAAEGSHDSITIRGLVGPPIRRRHSHVTSSVGLGRFPMCPTSVTNISTGWDSRMFDAGRVPGYVWVAWDSVLPTENTWSKLVQASDMVS